MPGILVDVPAALAETQWIFTAALMFHIRLGIEAYQVGKGLRFIRLKNGRVNWLAILLIGHLCAAVLEAILMTIMLGGFVKENYCQSFIRGVYAIYVVDTIFISSVLYTRALKVNSHSWFRHLIIVAAVIFPGLEIAARITEGVMIDASIPNSWTPPGTLSMFYGFCGAVFGWPTSFITATAIVNSVAQLSLFSIPIFKAIETSKGFGQTSSYIKILVKCASFLAVAVVFYLVSAAMGEQHNTWGAVTFREIAQLAHTLGACEVQFNDHRRTISSESSNSGHSGPAAGSSGNLIGPTRTMPSTVRMTLAVPTTDYEKGY